MRRVCVLGGLLLLFSCKVFKQRAELEQEEVEAMGLSLRQREQQIKLAEMLSMDKELEDSRVELVAKDVFYWHPDSGIMSKQGPIAIKIQSRLLKEQLLGNFRLSRQSNTKDTLLRHSQQLRKGVLVKKGQKNWAADWVIWFFLGIISAVLVFLWIRFFSRRPG